MGYAAVGLLVLAMPFGLIELGVTAQATRWPSRWGLVSLAYPATLALRLTGEAG